MPLHGALVHDGDFRQRETAEEFQLDDVRKFGFERRQVVESIAQVLQEFGLREPLGMVGVERGDERTEAASAPWPHACPDRKQVRNGLPFVPILPTEARRQQMPGNEVSQVE